MKRKLALCFGSVVIFFSLIIFSNCVVIYQMKNICQQIVDNKIPAALGLTILETDSEQLRLASDTMMYLSDKALEERQMEQVFKLKARIEAMLEQLRQDFADEPVKLQKLAEVERLFQECYQISGEHLNVIGESRVSSESLISTSKAHKIRFSQLNELLLDLKNLSLADLRKELEESRVRADAHTSACIVIAIICLILALILVSILSQLTAIPLRQLTEAADAIANEETLQEETILLDSDRNDEIGRLNKAFRKMNASLFVRTEDLLRKTNQLERANKIKGDFLANVSHEIRTPLNGILGLTEMLLRSELTGTQRDHAKIVQGTGQILLGIVEEILDLSKIDAGKLSLEKIEFNIAELVEGMGDSVSALIELKDDLTLLTFVDPQIPVNLIGDPFRLRQIIGNFLSNSIKFSTSGEILLKVSRESISDCGNRVRLKFSVSDQGIGISQQEQVFLFQPFVQADESVTRKYGGTGLGLTICKRLVELMDGEIGYESEKGEGSTFWIKVDLQKAETQTAKSVESNGSNLRVLIAEASSSAREIDLSYLVELGFKCDTAIDSHEVLLKLNDSVVKKEPYHLVIIDHSLPDLGGLGLSRVIKQNRSIEGVKLVLSTSSRYKEVFDKRLPFGFNACLFKPVKKQQLSEVIEMTMHETKSQLKSRDELEVTLRNKPQRRPELILVAEDHQVNQQVLQLFLRDMGFKAHFVEDGLKAVEAIKSGSYSLILMDCHMPVMSGLDATTLIRKWENQQEKPKRIPIVAVSANALKENSNECLNAGMDDFISKPIDPVNLEAILNKWLSIEAAVPEEPLTMQTLQGEVLDVVSDSGSINLTKLKKKHSSSQILQLLALFASTLSRDFKQLQTAIEALDSISLANNAHALKGVFAHMEVDNMKALCIEFEEIAQKADWKRANENLIGFEKSLGLLLSQIDGELSINRQDSR